MKAQAAVPALVFAIKVGLVLLLLSPLWVTQDTFFPFIVGKALYARFIIELTLLLWVGLVLIDRSYLPRRSLVLWLFAIWVGTSLLAAVLGVSFTRSFFSNFERMMGVWDLIHWLAVVLIASTVLRTYGSWKNLFNWNLGVAVVLGVIAMFQSLGWDWLPFLPSIVWLDSTSPAGRVSSTIGNPSFFGAYMLVSIFISFALLLQSFVRNEAEDDAADQSPEKSKRHPLWLQRSFWIVAAGISTYAMFESGTRGAIIAFGLTVALILPATALIWANRSTVKPILLGSAGVLVVFLAGFLLLQVAGLSPGNNLSGTGLMDRIFTTRTDDGSLGPRIYSWEASWHAFTDRPLFGWGPENYSSAFQKHVDVEYFGITGENLDQAHAKPIEEFVTKGLIGGVAYLVLWAAILYALIKRRTNRKHEVFAYVLLGALLGYFIQGLLLFDTPAMILQWSLLVAWVVSQEYSLRQPTSAQEVPASGSMILNRLRSGASWIDAKLITPIGSWTSTATKTPAGALTAFSAALSLLVIALVFTQAGAWKSADEFTKTASGTWTERITAASRSFDYAPYIANRARLEFFFTAALQYPNLSALERQQLDTFFHAEIDRALAAEPNDPILMIPVAIVEQLTGNDRQTFEGPAALDLADEFADRLMFLAPNHPTAHSRLAVQKLLRNEPAEALRISEEYLARVPSPRIEAQFQPIIDDARKRLGIKPEE